MSDEVKRFMFGLQKCQGAGGMRWHGKVPKEVYELFDLHENDSKQHFNVMGVYVEVVPAYEAFVPDWKPNHALGED